MSLLYHNDTSKIIKRISNKSLKSNRKRNLFAIVTIALASALLSAIVLYGFGVSQKTKNDNAGTAQIVYHALSEQQGQELYHQDEIAWVGEFVHAFSEPVDHAMVNFLYANAAMLKSQKMGYSGKLPAAENEIVVQKSFLDSLGYSCELGQIIQIPFSDGKTRDFRLTGILDVETGDIGQYTAIISKELVKQQYGNEASFDFYIGLGQFTRNYTQTVKRAADNKRRYAPGWVHSTCLLRGFPKGAAPHLAHDFAEQSVVCYTLCRRCPENTVAAGEGKGI